MKNILLNNEKKLVKAGLCKGETGTGIAVPGFIENEKVITVMSNKGGVGKTSIACGIALFCSKKLEKKTLLMELDSSPGDFGAIFDIEKDKSLEMAMSFPDDYPKFIKNISFNLDVLKGFSNPLIAEEIKKGAIDRLMVNILEDYRFVVIDTQTIINGTIIDVLKLSDKIFFINEFTLESIARISAITDTLIRRFLIPQAKMEMVINKKRKSQFFKLYNSGILSRMPVRGFIPFDSKYSKNDFLLNSSKILKTRFFKGISNALS
ncbi:MAG: AAA family ATPase [Actinobacteria bacterium]|nr:AAA family ATPase [Actinomycetota bacterium]